MNRRVAVIVAALVLLAVAGAWLWFTRLPTQRDAPDMPSDATQPSGAQSETSNIPTVTPSLPGELQRLVQRKASEENGPVEFFGKVVDQDGQPVAGVRIEGKAGYYVTTEFSGNAAVRDVRDQKPLVLESDAAGMFSVSGFHASWLQFAEFQKEGYVLGEKQITGFPFAPKHREMRPQSTPSNPVVFRMWQRGSAEPLISIERRVKVPSTGSHYLNLLTGEVSANPQLASDLRLAVEWQGEQPLPGGNWRLTLEAVNGGLKETNSVFMFRAPANGYDKQIVYDWESPDVQKWYRASQARRFFVMSRGGRLLSAWLVEIEVYPHEVVFRYRLWANPSGSTNLEPDPEKLITDAEEIRRLNAATQIQK